ncbi:MAG: MtnX-like HAD-IB family phosphatase [Burkholderiaceae bacterium]|nr:MtnX-like HAD-IB family phosphatase [Burkholderiaceae bacterium]
MQPWTVLCDFDGTIAVEDVTDSLLMRFGRPGWDVLETKWREGIIGSRDCMEGQVALLDCSADELLDHVSAIPIDGQFNAFVAEVEAKGWPLIVVSDGLDFAISAILQRHGLGRLPVIANRLVQAGPRRWKLEFPHARPDCAAASGTCKCARARPPAIAAGSKVLMIGDGASDFCVAGRADITFARKRLLEHCLDNGLQHQPVADFAQARNLLHTLSLSASAEKLPYPL